MSGDLTQRSLPGVTVEHHDTAAVDETNTNERAVTVEAEMAGVYATSGNGLDMFEHARLLIDPESDQGVGDNLFIGIVRTRNLNAALVA